MAEEFQQQEHQQPLRFKELDCLIYVIKQTKNQAFYLPRRRKIKNRARPYFLSRKTSHFVSSGV